MGFCSSWLWWSIRYDLGKGKDIVDTSGEAVKALVAIHMDTIIECMLRMTKDMLVVLPRESWNILVPNENYVAIPTSGPKLRIS